MINAGKAVPPGSLVIYAGSSAPAGWLLSNGQAVSRAQYNELFAVIGTTYGAGDGSTTFNLPNFVGRMPVGYYSGDAHTNALGKQGGEFTHTLTTGEIPSHSHQVSTNGGLYFEGGVSGYPGGTTGYGTQASTLQTGLTGGGGAHENMPPYCVVNFMIKT